MNWARKHTLRCLSTPPLTPAEGKQPWSQMTWRQHQELRRFCFASCETSCSASPSRCASPPPSLEGARKVQDRPVGQFKSQVGVLGVPEMPHSHIFQNKRSKWKELQKRVQFYPLHPHFTHFTMKSRGFNVPWDIAQAFCPRPPPSQAGASGCPLHTSAWTGHL